MVQLRPFPGIQENVTRSIKVLSQISAESDRLILWFKIMHPSSLEPLVIPKMKKNPQALDGLWKTTCFEAFFGLRSSRQYLEWNASPSGDWAFYGFQDYRNSQVSIQLVPDNQPQCKLLNRSNRELEAHFELPLRSLEAGFLQLGAIQGSSIDLKALRIGLTAVIDWQGVGCLYFALDHLGLKPDFHLKDSFQFKL